MQPSFEYWPQHKDRLRAYLAKRLPDGDAVDDILQDVYIKAHTSLHTVKSSGSITGWLFRIAANAIADHYRARRSWEELPEDLAAPEPERDYLGELAGCLQPLIGDLPEDYRTALVLAEIEGLTRKEVAARLGLSLSGAKSRVQRGRKELRRRLLQCCDVEMDRSGVIGYEVRDKNCDAGCR